MTKTVWRLLLRRVTTKRKVARKLRANCCSSGAGGGSFRLVQALAIILSEWRKRQVKLHRTENRDFICTLLS